MGPVSFSTVGLPEAKKIALWEEHNSRALIGLRCRMLGEAALDATELNLQLDKLHLARVRGNAHVVERPAAVIRRHPADAVAVYLTLVGEAFFYHEDGVLTLRPGQALICDADRPFLRGFSRGLEELAVKVPRPVFRELTGLDELRSPIVRDFARGDLSARTFARLVGHALTPPAPADAEAAHVTAAPGRPAPGQPTPGQPTPGQPTPGQPTPGQPAPARPMAAEEAALAADERLALELLASMAGRRDAGSVHVANARTFIELHLTDAGLSAARVAAAIGISERHLSRAFAATGSSVPQFVLARRLERAHALLTAAPMTPVSEVAARCGFGSAAHFSQAFRTRYDQRPTDLRRRSRTRGD